ncbi:MAG TPA: insulinase family protein [Bacteroidales bacterium]|nr:insulinase family protein [Bacteroidales bacterium]
MKTLKLLVLLLFAISLSNAYAQIELSAKAPIDPEIKIGKLENGLTYFIRKNKEPEKRASFYIIQNVGAILEDDDQQGLAHFLEHMAFNGTQHFPPMGIVSFLEKHGVAFGENINASTGYDQTVYNLSDVPVEGPGLIDSCLLVLNDWSHYLSLTDEEIDKERGVIEEEWRTRRDANTRMVFDVIIPVMYKGSRYAERNLIGNPEILRSFRSETLRSYYRKWYRPDLQAIAVVGDIDPAEVEKKITALFSKIPAPVNPEPRPEIEVPSHDETYFVLATDKESPQTSITVVTEHKAVRPEDKDLAYIRDRHVISLMNSMINTRISEIIQKPNPPFISGSVYYGTFLARGYEALMISAEARMNEEPEALEGIYREAERANKHGFNEGELKRAKASMLTSYESMYKQKDKISNETYMSGIEQYFLTGEPLTSIDFDYEFLKKVIDNITAEEVSARFREMMSDKNRTIIVQGLEGENVKHLSEAEAINILSSIETSDLAAYEDTETGESLLKKTPAAADPVSTTELPQFNAVEWTFANNAKVIFRHADYEKDNVLLTAFSFGGISKIEDKDLILPANIMQALVPLYGLGDYDNITLQKMMAGKKASLSLGLSETAESMSGSSTPRDFELLMQLLYLRFAQPRFDSLAHGAAIDRFSSVVANMEKDPDQIKSDSLSLILTSHNPRTPLLTKENVGKITLNDIRKIYTDRFNAADEFTFFIVGNIPRDTALLMAGKYIGSLPAKGRKEIWIDRDIKQPEGQFKREIVLPLAVPKSTVVISYENEMKYNPENYLGVEVIDGILDILYVEKVREDEGGTYGVSVDFSASKRPEESVSGLISFDCDPARANDLKSIIYKEIDNLVKKGPAAVNLDKAVNNILKNREEGKLHNAYWMGILSRYYSYGINSDDPANFENVLKSYNVKSIKKISGKLFKKADVADIVFMPGQ